MITTVGLSGSTVGLSIVGFSTVGFSSVGLSAVGLSVRLSVYGPLCEALCISLEYPENIHRSNGDRRLVASC